MYKVGFIGCGNMGSAIASAVAKTADPKEILLADCESQKAEDLASALGARTAGNEGVARECAYIFLAVKPQMMEEVLQPLAAVLKQREDHFVLVSMAAGLAISDIARMSAGSFPIIRIMPNTPVAVNKGMTLACASPEVREEDLDTFFRLMSESGRLDLIPEEWIDAAGALSGCGPAYVYLFLEALADGAAACGLPKEKALEYACQTAIGASSMVRETGRDPGELTEAVCSPGGTTIEGVHALEQGKMQKTVMEAVKAAYDKTALLKKQ
ncbi:MAG: pyrroline-5-carboxylate reductase [Lachnospiraceae bacterium]|nr:pyrroline-5-carboxylate reductase [Lachnospiraceae bacterium]